MGWFRYVGPVNLAGAWRRRMQAMTWKPDEETELPRSNEPAAEEESAIEREREKRAADRQDERE